MKRIILSLAMIAFVGAAAVGATGAFFSDSETSTGNTFAAGDIDLKLKNTSYVVSHQTGIFGASATTTWDWNDLTDQLFFNFVDVKPGDYGEDTIGIKVNSNDAWLCAAVTVTENDDVTCNDSELADDASCVEPDSDVTDGDLAQSLSFMWWADDGDNVLETGETVITQGELGDAPLNTPINIALADSNQNIWSGTGPVPGASERYIGKGWCFGTMTSTPVSQDGVATSGPLVRGTGFTCSGASATNAAQTDRTKLDVAFMAVQSRNNNSFVCDGVPASGPIAIDTEVRALDLASSPAEVASNPTKWFFYNDETDVIDNSLGSFVVGPTTPTSGTGSAQMSVAGSQRKNIATYQFKDIKLADIDAMSFATLSQSVGNPGSTQRAPYLHFNVDFNNSDTWQKRLVFVPSTNGTVVPDTWQTWNTGGTSLWTWSGFVANGNMWPDGNTNANRTWNSIVAAWPNAETRSTDSWLGVRVGEPYADGFTGNVDSFSMTVNGVTKKFDFEN